MCSNIDGQCLTAIRKWCHPYSFALHPKQLHISGYAGYNLLKSCIVAEYLNVHMIVITSFYSQDTEDDPAGVYQDTTYPVISVRRVERQKKRCCVQLCLFAGMILGLSLCVLGSVFLYRNMYTVVCMINVYTVVCCQWLSVEYMDMGQTDRESTKQKQMTAAWACYLFSCRVLWPPISYYQI